MYKSFHPSSEDPPFYLVTQRKTAQRPLQWRYDYVGNVAAGVEEVRVHFLPPSFDDPPIYFLQHNGPCGLGGTTTWATWLLELKRYKYIFGWSVIR